MRQTKSILIVCPYPLRVAPGQRFRFEQYLGQLAANGYCVRIEAFLSTTAMAVVYRPGHLLMKTWGVIWGFLRRIRLLFSMSEYDYAFIFREATPLGPPFFEAALFFLNCRVIYDFDDAIYLTKTSDANKVVSFAKCSSKVRFITRRAWKVSVSTAFLMNWARQYNDNVVLLPTTVDLDYHRPIYKAPLNTRRPVIGWTGSHSTVPYLELVRPALGQLQVRYDFEFRVICDVDPKLTELKNYRFVPWRLISEIEDLAAIDIGLMPLPQGEWESGKAGFKAIQYSGVGAVPVVSSTDVGHTVVIDGQTGFVVDDNSSEAWVRAIGRLLENPSLINEMGKLGREFVKRQFSVDSQQQRFLSLFSDSK